MKKPTVHRGFTLIELLIVVTIIGIIAAIAYPSYRDYMVQTRRADGQSLLLQTAGKMEKYYSHCGAYTNQITSGTVSGCSGLGTINESDSKAYTVSATTSAVSSVNNQAYVLTATRVAGGPQANDTGCGDLTLSSTGLKGRTGSLPIDKCWKR